MATKKCKRCNEDKDVLCFGRNKNKKDGLNIYCLECARKMTYESLKKHPWLINKWNKENKEKSANAKKEWAKRNNEKCKLANERFKDKNPSRYRYIKMKSRRKQIENVSSSYIRQMLGIKFCDENVSLNSLVDLKRTHILLKREIKRISNAKCCTTS